MLSTLERTYRRYNKKYFGGRLPAVPDPLTVRWGSIKFLGHYEGDEIVINARFRKRPSIWKMTLLHEMAHLSCPDEVVHGEKFQKEMMRLARAGAFRGLW